MPSDIDYAYLAGVMDGEGCIGVYRDSRNGNYYLQVCVAQTNTKDLTMLRDMFGGRLNKNLLRWNAHKGENILRKVFPYLRWKKNEAELAIAFCCQCMNEKAGTRIPQPNKSLAQFIREQLSIIKKQKYAIS